MVTLKTVTIQVTSPDMILLADIAEKVIERTIGHPDCIVETEISKGTEAT